MKTPFLVATVFAFTALAINLAQADWLTMPSRYSHDAASGRRVTQYAPVTAPTTQVSTPIRSSGYTHFRSSLAFGQSADNYHRVEAWGDPIRPYGEWRFPYRPYSTPYPNWGTPFAGLNLGLAGGLGYGAPGFGYGTPQVPIAPFIPGTQPAPVPNPNTGPTTNTGPNSDAVTAPNAPIVRPRAYRRPSPYPPAATDNLSPYPAGPGTPYPVAPYYDGYYPSYRQ